MLKKLEPSKDGNGHTFPFPVQFSLKNNVYHPAETCTCYRLPENKRQSHRLDPPRYLYTRITYTSNEKNNNQIYLQNSSCFDTLTFRIQRYAFIKKLCVKKKVNKKGNLTIAF